MNLGPVNVVVLVLFISFAIDRTTTGLIFALSSMLFGQDYFRGSNSENDTKNNKDSEKIYRAVYFLIATLLAITILMFIKIDGKHIGIFSILKIEGIYEAVDIIITGLILVTSSDFLSRLIEKSGAYDKTELEGQTIHVTGNLTLDRPPKDAGDSNG